MFYGSNTYGSSAYGGLSHENLTFYASVSESVTIAEDTTAQRFFTANVSDSVSITENATIDRGATSGAWYNLDWSCRKRVKIQAASGAGTNYQVLLKIGATNSATGADFDLESAYQIFPTGKDDSGDLVITTGNGSTTVDFWVEKVTGSGASALAYVWVEVPHDMSVVNPFLYVYYSNGNGSDLSNGDNTFILFDDFNDGSINATKWTTVTGAGGGSISEASDNLLQNDSDVSASYTWLFSQSQYSAGVAARMRFKRVDNGGYGNGGLRFTDDNDGQPASQLGLSYANFENNVTVFHTDSAVEYLSEADLTQSTYYIWESRWYTSTTSGGTLWSDAYVGIGDPADRTGSAASNYYLGIRSADGADLNTDYVFLRKVIAGTEPAFSAADTQETNEPFVTSGVDTVAISESVTIDLTGFASVFDAVGITESQTTLVELSVSASDQAAISESVSELKALYVGDAVDAVSISEAVTTSGAAANSSAESVSIAESVSPTQVFGVSLGIDITGNRAGPKKIG